MKPEIILESLLAKFKLNYVKEYKFYPNRKWRLDYFLPDKLTGIEIEGSTFSNGRHTRGIGYGNDCKKYNMVSLLGFKLIRFTTDDFRKGNVNYVIETLEKLK